MLAEKLCRTCATSKQKRSMSGTVDRHCIVRKVTVCGYQSCNSHLERQCTLCTREKEDPSEFPCSICAIHKDKPYFEPEGVTYGNDV